MYFEHDNDDMESFWTIPTQFDFFLWPIRSPATITSGRKGESTDNGTMLFSFFSKHRATCINVHKEIIICYSILLSLWTPGYYQYLFIIICQLNIKIHQATIISSTFKRQNNY